MKKLSTLLILILLAGGGFFAYKQGWLDPYLKGSSSKTPEAPEGPKLSVNALEELAKTGKNFEAYGFKLIIPPQSDAPKADANGAIEIKTAFLDIKTFAGENAPDLPIPIQSAKLSLAEKNSDQLILEVPEFGQQLGILLVHKLRFHLSSRGTWHGIDAEKIEFFEPHPSISKKTAFVQITKPRLEWGSLTNFSPMDRFSIGFDGIVSNDPMVDIKFGALRGEFKSKQKGEKRHAEGSFTFAGGKITPDQTSHPGDGLEFKPLEITAEGTSKALSYDQGMALFKELVAEIRTLVKSPNPDKPENFTKLLAAAEKLFLAMEPESQKFTYKWKGMHFKERVTEFEISNFNAKLDQKFGQKIAQDMSLSLEKIDFNKGRLDSSRSDAFLLEGLEWTGKSETDLSYADTIKMMVRFFYKDVIEQMWMNHSGLVSSDPMMFLRSLRFQTDRSEDKIQIKKLFIQDGKTKLDHTDLHLGFKLDETSFVLGLKGKLDHDYNQPADMPNIENGSADIKLTLRFPVKKLIGALRTSDKILENPEDLFKLFAGVPSGFELDGKIDFGKNWFQLDLSSTLLADLGKLKLPPKPQSTDPYESAIWTQNLGAEFAKVFLFDSETMKGSLRVKPFSKVVALGLLPPFFTPEEIESVLSVYGLDKASDSFNSSLELKDGKLLINGKADPTINMAYQEMKQEISRPKQRRIPGPESEPFDPAPPDFPPPRSIQDEF